MYNVRHHLSNDFPEFTTMIEYLKKSDAEFIRLLNQYHATNKKISGYEKKLNPEEPIKHLKRWRVQLKDRLYRILKNYEGVRSAGMINGAT